MPPAIVTSSAVEAPPEVQALRDELSILHGIFHTLSSASIKAAEWEMAGKWLGYLNGKTVELEAQVQSLLGEKAVG